MNATRTFSALLATALLATLPAAQTPPAKPELKPTPLQAKPKEAGHAAEAGELHLALTGLTQDNQAKVKDSLSALSTGFYTCAACKVEQAAAGNCPKCKAPLQAAKRADFLEIKPSPDSGMLDLKLAPAMSVRLSEIENALAKNQVKVDEAKVPIRGRVHLVVKGVKADGVAALEKTLTEAKLFEELKARYDTDSSEVRILVQAGASAPTRAKVVAALEGAKAQLVDIVWGPMSPKG